MTSRNFSSVYYCGARSSSATLFSFLRGQLPCFLEARRDGGGFEVYKGWKGKLNWGFGRMAVKGNVWGYSRLCENLTLGLKKRQEKGGCRGVGKSFVGKLRGNIGTTLC